MLEKLGNSHDIHLVREYAWNYKQNLERSSGNILGILKRIGKVLIIQTMKDIVYQNGIFLEDT